MKSSALGVILGLAALAGVGVLYLKVDDLSDQLRPLTQSRATVDRPATDTDWPDRGPPPRSARPSRTVGDEAAPFAAPRTVDDRVAQLELQIERLKAERVKSGGRARGWRFPRFTRNMEYLSRTLKLSPAQDDRVRQIVERGKRRIEDVMKIPDSEGRSPHERRLERREKIRDAVTSGKTDGLVNLAMGAMAYRNKEIPGRGKNYGEEVDRIRKETRAEIDRELGPEQRDTFENTRIDSLVGGGGGNSVVMTTHWEAGDSAEGVAIVGGSVEVEAVTEEDGGE